MILSKVLKSCLTLSEALLMSQSFLWAENFIPIFPKEKQTLKHEQNPKYNSVLAF